MKWNGDKIKNLRRRMGWGYADLARRLKCPMEQVLAWESGAQKVNSDFSSQLDIFESQLETSTAQKGAQPRAESVMRDKRIDQITNTQLDDAGSE